MSQALAADLPTKAPEAPGCTQAVDGVNGKVAGLGGSFANDNIDGAFGSLSAPLGCGYGVQLDAAAMDFDGRFLGGLAGHLFWRDPSTGLLGVYGSYTHWDEFTGLTANHVGPEAEWYSGRWTLRGIAGAEFGNSTSGMVGPLLETYSVTTRFFDQVDVAYYPVDNWEVYAGHRYLGGENALALGSEWGVPLSHGMMAALFAEGRVGQDDFRGVWGGLRIYFGQHDKTLIRRHREDDPPDWGDGFDGTSNSGSGSTPATACLPPNIIIEGSCSPPT